MEEPAERELLNRLAKKQILTILRKYKKVMLGRSEQSKLMLISWSNAYHAIPLPEWRDWQRKENQGW